MLLNQQESAEQEEQTTGMIIELLSVPAEDLKAPRFMRPENGLMMINGEAAADIH